jgi:anti-anti-sigma regulatory factor
MYGDVRWENNARTVIRFTFSGEWDWDEFYRVLDQREPCVPGQNTCALIDLRAVRSVPADAVQHLRRAAHMLGTTGGMIIVIATSVNAATTFRLFVTIYRSVAHRFRLVESDRDAFDILQMPL